MLDDSWIRDWNDMKEPQKKDSVIKKEEKEFYRRLIKIEKVDSNTNDDIARDLYEQVVDKKSVI